MENGNKIAGKEYTAAYTWGDACKAWLLQQSENVIIKEEMMPPGTSESLHLHEGMEQFFYILEGQATFILDGKTVHVKSREGLSIRAGLPHKIINNTKEPLTFIVISAPGSAGDRIEIGD